MQVRSIKQLMEDAKENAEEAKAEKPKAASEKKKSTRASGSRTRKPAKAIPARVEPGWIHYDIANAILKFLASSLTVEVATPEGNQELSLNVGDPKEDDAPEEEVEQREPAELLARVIAHLFHRTPGLRNIEKRLEGREAKSGIGSDLAALATQLYRRNKHLVPVIADFIRSEAQRAQAEKKAAAQKKAAPKVVPTSEGREGIA